MIGFLRVVGVLNASLWFGGSVFFTFFVGPAFFSEAMLKIMSKLYAGLAAQVVLERYFILQLVCGFIALGHLVGESLYLSRPIFRWSLALVAGILFMGLIGGYGIQPKLTSLHRTMYLTGATPEEVAAARKSFGRWHGVSWVLNLAAVGGMAVYVLRITRQGDNSRRRW